MAQRELINYVSTRRGQTKQFASVVLAFSVVLWSALAEELPPAPKDYFNDYAGVTSQATQHALNERLAKFDKDTTDQVVVAIFPENGIHIVARRLHLRVANAWGVGQHGKNNGVTLFIFVQDHTMRIQVGDGLTGVLTDALSKQILDRKLGPHFQRGDFDGGLTAAVDSMLKIIGGAASSDHLGSK